MAAAISTGGCAAVRALASAFVRRLRPYSTSPLLTPAEVTAMLKEHEESSSSSFALPSVGPVKSYDLNLLSSNSPIEDAHAEGIVRSMAVDTGPGNEHVMFAVFDGHAGPACAQVVSSRLLDYIAAGLLPPDDLASHAEIVNGGLHRAELVDYVNRRFELVPDLQELYKQSYHKHVDSLLARCREDPDAYASVPVADRLCHAFDSLDSFLSSEALAKKSDADLGMKTMTVAMSGAVAAVAHISGADLHVASTGDCNVVLGSLSENDTWVAKKLTTDHNSDNQSEIKRIQGEHPDENVSREIIVGERLLGMLAPLRAFGDFRFKWDRETIQKTMVKHLGQQAVPPNLKTPPYLIATPEVTYHRLTPRDKFIVMGSDGLWDMMTPMQVIRLVGEHMSGKITLTPLMISGMTRLHEINEVLRHRQAAMRLKPDDSNAATHLIRSALGGSAYGVDHGRLSQMLSLPPDMVRLFRDDITVQVVFFDTEYLGHCS